MGKYDNYSNRKNIEKAHKKLNRLTGKRKPDLYRIEMAQKELDTAKLFENCQIFGREDFWKRDTDPNAAIMFSDDNRVMMFADKLIHYEDISSYAFVENRTAKSHTVTKKSGVISRAIVGGAIAGDVGALVGAMSAGSESKTTFYETADGFFLQIFLKDGKGYQYPVENAGFISNKLSRRWLELGTKLQAIIDNNAKEW